MSDINEIPESFNKSLLDKALLEYTNDPSLELIDYKIQDNSEEISYHFSSIMFKVDLEYKRASDDGDDVYHIHAIVKTLPDAPDQSYNTYLECVKETAQFDTELLVYDKILPKIELMLSGMEVSSLAPMQIYQTNAPVPILIMEDMISLGYTTINDRSQISFDSSRMLIGKLAQFHATSFVLNKQMDETVAQLNGVYFDYHMDRSYCEDMDKGIEAMKKFNGFDQIVAKLEGSTEEMFDTIRGVYHSQNDESCIKVLCHGDMKFENTLIKTNENGIGDCVFVDFAYTNLNTPAIDLFEFLYKVPALDVIIRKELRDELINHYIDVFGTVLAKTGVEEIEETIQNVKNEIHRCNVLQVWFVLFLVVYKLELFNEESDADIEVKNYEEKWLKTVLDELLINGNDE